MEGAALVRLTARINLACVKKSQGCNYTEMEGQRDGSLFATAWTLLLSDCENGIYLVQRKETAHNFCLSTCPFAVPPHGLTHSIVVASFLSGHFFASINGNPTVQSFTEFFIFEGQWQPDRRERTQLKQMGSADSCTEEEKVNQFEMGVQKWTWQASVIKSKAYGKEKCSRNLIESNVIILGGN